MGLLRPETRRRWLFLVFLALASALLEAICALALFLVLGMVTNPTHRATVWLTSFASRIGLGSLKSAAPLACLVVAVLCVLRSVTRLYEVYRRHDVACRSMSEVSDLLLQRYLTAPHLWHVQRHSSDLQQRVMQLGESIYRNLIVAIVGLCVDVTNICVICIIIFIVSPGPALATLLFFGILVLALLGLTQRVHRRWGRQERETRTALARHVTQSFQGLKQLRLLDCESFVSLEYRKLIDALAIIGKKRGVTYSLPRAIMETLFMVSALGLLGFILVSGTAVESWVPVAGLCIYSGMRMLPTVNSLIAGSSEIQFHQHALDEIERDLESIAAFTAARRMPEQQTDAEGTAALELRRVTFVYPGKARPAVREVDLTLRVGECIGIVGSSGAGKSTLIDVILGLLTPTEGEVRLGRTAEGAPLKRGCVPQDTFLFDGSILANIAVGVPISDVDLPRVQRCLEMARLDEMIEQLPQKLETHVGERGVRLSGGQRQRIAIARALYHDPDLLVLDEATSSLDNQTEWELSTAVSDLRGKVALVIVAHRLSTVTRCDRVILLEEGRITGEGRFDELLASSVMLQRMVELGRLPDIARPADVEATVD